MAGRVAGESLDLQPPGPSNAESRCDQYVQNRARYFTYYEVPSNPNGLVPHTRESMVWSYTADDMVYHQTRRYGLVSTIIVHVRVWFRFGDLKLKVRALFKTMDYVQVGFGGTAGNHFYQWFLNRKSNTDGMEIYEIYVGLVLVMVMVMMVFFCMER